MHRHFAFALVMLSGCVATEVDPEPIDNDWPTDGSCPAPAGKLTLYAIAPPIPLDWSSPNELLRSVQDSRTEGDALVASGDADIAIQPTSELARVPGLDYLGPIPDELQLIQTFCAAIVSGSKELEASRRLIAFLSSGRAAAAIRNNGMQPVQAFHSTQPK